MVPPLAYCDRQFFQDIIAGKKGLLSPDEAKMVDVLKFREFKVSEALKLVKESRLAHQVVPDKWFKPKAKVHRGYLWMVLNSFH